jgi:hypothetical protein
MDWILDAAGILGYKLLTYWTRASTDGLTSGDDI